VIGGRRAFTLVEMLTVISVLVIVLGLMVSLARHVRERSAQTLTKNLLRQLDLAVVEYAKRHAPPGRSGLPAATPFPPSQVVEAAAANAPATRPAAAQDAPRKADREALRLAALANNHGFVRALAREQDLAERVLAGLPASVYDGQVLRDGWGSPIVFMPDKHPWIGTAPRDRSYFFFSAGPDRDYLTPVDNLYSYEELADRSR
jgi:prepilin-type N-terminal cleavage/methylation domain-containing protein